MLRKLTLEDTLPFKMYPSYEPILNALARDLSFEYWIINNLSCGRSKYKLSDISYVKKDFVNDFIANSDVNKEANRAKILYNMYSCRWLVISGIKYPTYLDWKLPSNSDMTLDHMLPKKYFPLLTFDCSNWQPLSIEDNQEKGVEFIPEGRAAIAKLKDEIDTAFEQAMSKIKA